MEEMILLGRGRQMLELPTSVWKGHLAQIPEHSQDMLGFMSEQHHRVRYFVVSQLVDGMQPISPKLISDKLNLPLERVEVILDELESKLFFLVRNSQGEVAWAYPVTIEPTPHRLTFSTGERLYAA